MLDLIKPALNGLNIDVYLGLWCPDSRRNVPPFLKILDRLGAEIPVRYLAVPRKPSREVKYYVPEMKVERVQLRLLQGRQGDRAHHRETQDRHDRRLHGHRAQTLVAALIENGDPEFPAFWPARRALQIFNFLRAVLNIAPDLPME